MKKIIMLLCFAVNASLVAADGKAWKVLDEVSNVGNYALNKSGKLAPAMIEGRGIFVAAYKHCCDKDRVSEDQIYSTFKQILNVGYQIGLQELVAKHVTLKNLIMSSTRPQKFGYGVVAALAVYGAVQVVFAIKNKLRKVDEA